MIILSMPIAKTIHVAELVMATFHFMMRCDEHYWPI